MEKLYVVFDGPPGPEGPKFIEVENEQGRSIGCDAIAWKQRDDGYWTLGPFQTVSEGGDGRTS